MGTVTAGCFLGLVEGTWAGAGGRKPVLPECRVFVLLAPRGSLPYPQDVSPAAGGRLPHCPPHGRTRPLSGCGSMTGDPGVLLRVGSDSASPLHSGTFPLPPPRTSLFQFLADICNLESHKNEYR